MFLLFNNNFTLFHRQAKSNSTSSERVKIIIVKIFLAWNGLIHQIIDIACHRIYQQRLLKQFSHFTTLRIYMTLYKYKVRQSSFNKLSKWRVASTIPFIFRDILNQELTSFNTVGVKITKSNSLTHGDTLTFCWLRVLIDLNKGKAITCTHHSAPCISFG